MQLQIDTLSRELNFIKPEHFPAYQVGMLFSGNIIMLFLSSFGDSVISLCVLCGKVEFEFVFPLGCHFGILVPK